MKDSDEFESKELDAFEYVKSTDLSGMEAFFAKASKRGMKFDAGCAKKAFEQLATMVQLLIDESEVAGLLEQMRTLREKLKHKQTSLDICEVKLDKTAKALGIAKTKAEAWEAKAFNGVMNLNWKCEIVRVEPTAAVDAIHWCERESGQLWASVNGEGSGEGWRFQATVFTSACANFRIEEVQEPEAQRGHVSVWFQSRDLAKAWVQRALQKLVPHREYVVRGEWSRGCPVGPKPQSKRTDRFTP